MSLSNAVAKSRRSSRIIVLLKSVCIKSGIISDFNLCDSANPKLVTRRVSLSGLFIGESSAYAHRVSCPRVVLVRLYYCCMRSAMAAAKHCNTDLIRFDKGD